jgi:hypothetical protein
MPVPLDIKSSIATAISPKVGASSHFVEPSLLFGYFHLSLGFLSCIFCPTSLFLFSFCYIYTNGAGSLLPLNLIRINLLGHFSKTAISVEFVRVQSFTLESQRK